MAATFSERIQAREPIRMVPIAKQIVIEVSTPTIKMLPDRVIHTPIGDSRSNFIAMMSPSTTSRNPKLKPNTKDGEDNRHEFESEDHSMNGDGTEKPAIISDDGSNDGDNEAVDDPFADPFEDDDDTGLPPPAPYPRSRALCACKGEVHGGCECPGITLINVQSRLAYCNKCLDSPFCKDARVLPRSSPEHR
jgi:hypothetical protein